MELYRNEKEYLLAIISADFFSLVPGNESMEKVPLSSLKTFDGDLFQCSTILFGKELFPTLL